MATISPQRTIHYKSYVKTALVQALRDVFTNHIDSLLAKTKVTIDYPLDRADYPTIIVRFFERDLRNMGVGHIESIRDANGVVTKYKHYFYTGDIEFGILALSSLDRDLLSDSLVEIISMGNLAGYTNQFFERIYAPSSEPTSPDYDPYTGYHFINLNTDQIQGFGENQQIAPWMAEDVLVYQCSYRIGITGEFYSLPPAATFGIIEQVDAFPYMGENGDPVPTGKVADPAKWLTDGDL